MNWTELEIFEGIDINDSFVLSWRVNGNELVFEIEASIWPKSIYYEKPIKSEYTCYKPAIIKFSNIQDIKGLKEMSQVSPLTDSLGEKDYDSIDTLEITNEGFFLEGSFGSVSLLGGDMSFEVKET